MKSAKFITLILTLMMLCVSCQSTGSSKGGGGFGYMKRSMNNLSHGYKVVDDPTGKAPTAKVQRFEVRDGDCSHGDGSWSDCANDRERSELAEERVNRIAYNGTEFWYTWSVYFPEDFPLINPTKTSVGQFHQHQGHVLWMTQLREDGMIWDHQVFGGRTSVVYSLIDIEDLRGKWHTFKIHVLWSKYDDGPKMGFMKVWVNDKLKVDYIGQTCNSKKLYFKYGIYRSYVSRYKNRWDKDTLPTQVAYYTNVKRGRTEESIMSIQTELVKDTNIKKRGENEKI